MFTQSLISHRLNHLLTCNVSYWICLVQTAVDTPHVTRHCIELQGESRSCGLREGSEKSSDSGLLPSSPSSSPSSTPSRRASSLLPSSCSSSSAGGEPDLGNYCTLPRKGRQAASTSFHTVAKPSSFYVLSPCILPSGAPLALFIVFHFLLLKLFYIYYIDVHPLDIHLTSCIPGGF